MDKTEKKPVVKDFDKFRHEVYKLGLTGLDKSDQLDARVELAIKLGAKPKSWIKKHQPLGATRNKSFGPQKEKISKGQTFAQPRIQSQSRNGQTRKADKYLETNSTLPT